jgi:peptidyl-prolyl cis-trans isomerase C
MRRGTAMKKSTKLFVLAGLLVLGASIVIISILVSGGKDRLPSGKELARINDHVITLAEFEQEMEQLPSHLKTLMIEEKGRKEFLQNLIERELLLEEGFKKGLDKDEKIAAKVERVRQGLIIEALVEELYTGKDTVSDDEVRSYYQKNQEKYLLRDRVRVRHIMVKTLEEAKEIKKRLSQGEDFIALAKQYSIWPTKQQGGELGYIQRGMVDKAFERVAFSLKRGETSDIVKTNLGFHLIRLEDRQKPRQLTFPEVQEDIKKFLRDKKRKDIFTDHLKELQEGAHIQINEELLAAEKEKGS